MGHDSYDECWGYADCEHEPDTESLLETEEAILVSLGRMLTEIRQHPLAREPADGRSTTCLLDAMFIANRDSTGPGHNNDELGCLLARYTDLERDLYEVRTDLGAVGDEHEFDEIAVCPACAPVTASLRLVSAHR